jgi:protein O-mannosyl-transferase
MGRTDCLQDTQTAPALLVVAVLLAWFPSLTGPFQFDDYNVVVNNPAVHSLAAWLESMPGIRPLLKLTYAFNWIAGAGAFGFHLFNVLVHAANAVILFYLLRTLRKERMDDIVPFAAALLFALHPVQTEAVTYISGRSVSLMALFYLGSVLAYMRADSMSCPWRWRAGSAVLFAMAVLTRETAVTLPLALLLVEAAAANASLVQVLKRQGLHWAVLVFCLLVMAASPAYRNLADVSFATRPFWANLLTQANAMGWLAGQLLMPWNLSIDPDLPIVTEWSRAIAFKLLALVAVAATGFAALHRAPWLAFGILWYLLHLLPTNSIVPRLDVANDRHLYLAGIGAYVIAGIAIQALLARLHRRWLVHCAIAVMMLGLGAATLLRNQVYGSQQAFWEDAAAKSPAKPRVHNNLGWAYQQEGRLPEARRAYERALELDADYWRARINLELLHGAPDMPVR